MTFSQNNPLIVFLRSFQTCKNEEEVCELARKTGPIVALKVKSSLMWNFMKEDELFRAIVHDFEKLPRCSNEMIMKFLHVLCDEMLEIKKMGIL